LPLRKTVETSSFKTLTWTHVLLGRRDSMKYYDEEKMAEIRNTFDKEVLKWKGVTSKPMMGCLCYFYNRKFIGFLVTDGIVLMKLQEKDQVTLKEKFGGKPFEMAGQTGRLWVTPLKEAKDVRSSCHL
jgi:hypothetical protein